MEEEAAADSDVEAELELDCEVSTSQLANSCVYADAQVAVDVDPHQNQVEVVLDGSSDFFVADCADPPFLSMS